MSSNRVAFIIQTIMNDDRHLFAIGYSENSSHHTILVFAILFQCWTHTFQEKNSTKSHFCISQTVAMNLWQTSTVCFIMRIKKKTRMFEVFSGKNVKNQDTILLFLFIYKSSSIDSSNFIVFANYRNSCNNFQKFCTFFHITCMHEHFFARFNDQKLGMNGCCFEHCQTISKWCLRNGRLTFLLWTF